MKYALIAIGWFLLAAGAAQSAVPIPEIPPDAKTLAIIPAFPNQIRYAAGGITRIGNINETDDVSDWNLRGYAADVVTSALGSRFECIRPEVSVNVEGARGSGLSDALRAQVPSDVKADLFLVLWLSPEADPPAMQRPAVGFQGIGITKLQDMVRVDPRVHVFLMLAVIDGHDFSVLASSKLLVPKGQFMPEKYGGPIAPMKILDGFDWQNTWSDLSPASQSRVHETLKEILRGGLQYTLAEMRLTN